MNAALRKIPGLTPIEDFGARHWGMLLVLEEALVDGEDIARLNAEVRTWADLLAHGFIDTEAKPQTLTDRGWEVSGAIRRWKGERKNIDDFVTVVCESCSRIRYGERRPCVCGGAK